MGYYLDTTRAERFAAEKIADLSISDVEVASKILGSTWEEYFGELEQQAIGANEATELGRIIYASLRLINAAIDEYHLTLGHYLEQRTEIFVERAAQVAKTIEAEKRLKLQEKQAVPIQLSKPVIWIMIAQLSF